MHRKKKVVIPLPKGKPESDFKSQEQLVELLPELFALSKPFTLMLLEIDEYDGLNKVFGPDRCGRMREEMALILRQSLRKSDLVAPFGEKGFGAVLKGTGPRMAYEVGDRIRVAIKEAAFAPEHGHVLKISISGGHATRTKKASFQTPEDLISAALESLREAKKSGQDHIVGYRRPSSTLDFPETDAKY